MLENRVEDQENRARRNNLRLIGLPEKAEGNDLCAFPGKMAYNSARHGHLSHSSPSSREQAHRIGRLSAGQDLKPRAVIIRFLNYREKESAVRAAARQSTVKFENHSVRFYPDYSVETHRQQRLFDRREKAATVPGAPIQYVLPGYSGGHATTGSGTLSRRSTTQKSLFKESKATPSNASAPQG